MFSVVFLSRSSKTSRGIVRLRGMSGPCTEDRTCAAY